MQTQPRTWPWPTLDRWADRRPERAKAAYPKPFLNGDILALPRVWAGRSLGPSRRHGSHRFQPPALSRHRRQRPHAAHRPHAAARLRRARRLRGRGRRGRPRRLHPSRAGHRDDRLGDADLRRPRAHPDDPPARRQRQPVRADHHGHRPHREGRASPPPATPASPNSWPSRSRPRRSISASSTSSPIRGRSSRPRPISARTAGATSTPNYVGPERRKGGKADVIRQQALLDKAKHARVIGLQENLNMASAEAGKARRRHLWRSRADHAGHQKAAQDCCGRPLPGEADPVARAEAGAGGDLRRLLAPGCTTSASGSTPPAARSGNRGCRKETRQELFLAAHDVKGDSGTLRLSRGGAPPPTACAGCWSTPPISTKIPLAIVDQHVDAVRAIVREHARADIAAIAARPDRQAARGDRRIPGRARTRTARTCSRRSRARRSRPASVLTETPRVLTRAEHDPESVQRFSERSCSNKS